MVEILCFQHCDTKAFFIDTLPEYCPVCQASLADCHLKLPPFRVPNPFKSLHYSDKMACRRREQCKVVICTAFGSGDFLHDYDSKGNLHIAVTDSRGDVFEYDTVKSILAMAMFLVLGPYTLNVRGNREHGNRWFYGQILTFLTTIPVSSLQT